MSVIAPLSATRPFAVFPIPSARRFSPGLLFLVLTVVLGLVGCEMRTGSERLEHSVVPAADAVPVSAPAPALGDPVAIVSQLISGVFAGEGAEQLAPLVDPSLLPSLHQVLDAVQAARTQGDDVSLGEIRPDTVRITASVTVRTTITQKGKTREDTSMVPLEFADGHWRVTSLNF